MPGTLSNNFLTDGKCETEFFHGKIWNHLIETTILKWMFWVPGGDLTTNHPLFSKFSSYPPNDLSVITRTY